MYKKRIRRFEVVGIYRYLEKKKKSISGVAVCVPLDPLWVSSDIDLKDLIISFFLHYRFRFFLSSISIQKP